MCWFVIMLLSWAIGILIISCCVSCNCSLAHFENTLSTNRTTYVIIVKTGFDKKINTACTLVAIHGWEL
jgi:coenzyme F420-reducing hydrogenase gamma subunit